MISEDKPMSIDLHEFMLQFHDCLAPKLDVCEQAIYLYLFRHSRLIGKKEVVKAFKSDRDRLPAGIGEHGKPMSENTCRRKIESLQRKGCVTIIDTVHRGKSHNGGRKFTVHLPSEMEGIVVVAPAIPPSIPDLETADFYNIPEHQKLLFEREGNRCFYTLRPLTPENRVVEHVISRPVGDNSYRNCVAASREVNNKKLSASAEDFLRRLHREGYLSEAEFEDRMNALKLLKAGELRPRWPPSLM